MIARGQNLEKIIHFGHEQVFNGATTYTCLLFLKKSGNDRLRFINVDDLVEWRGNNAASGSLISTEKVIEGEWNLFVGPGAKLFERLNKMPLKLGDLADKIFQGLITGADPVFILDILDDGHFFSKATNQVHTLECELMHPLCKGSINIRRYHVNDLTKAILFSL